jgi:15-cis-phytoene desaturase
MTKTKVIIAGGGVAGLSAAHELITRGFDVEVYEHHDIPGGKARSMGIPGTGKDGKHDLPAEHGFRFFPGYYRHVINTMEHIPYWDTKETVSDRLIDVDQEALVSFTNRAIVTPAKMPSSLGGFLKLRKQMQSQPKVNFDKGELRFYVGKLWQIVTSCHARRDDQYEQIPWWEFIGANKRSVNYKKYLADISRTLVAADPKKVSTRTNGNVWIQTLMGMWGKGGDRVLDGPTNEVWIYPWLKYLLDQGVKYYINASVMEVKTNGEVVTGMRVEGANCSRDNSDDDNTGRDGAIHTQMARVLDCDRYGITKVEIVDGERLEPTGDYYISAVPVERMAELLTHHVAKGDTGLSELDPAFDKIEQLQYSVQWMNGIQFYLKGDGPPRYLPGHHIHVDAPFALTSIFQTHYWKGKDRKGIDLSKYGDGTLRAIFSVDISDWNDAPGRIYDKCAIDLHRKQVFEEVWTDLKCGLRHNPLATLCDENLITWNLDSDITEMNQIRLKNREPLLVNRVNTWRLRPEAVTKVSNLLLASDYVRTNTDLATMEGANEAARRAVNGILEATGSDRSRCRLWKLQEPAALKPFREYDLQRFNLGEEWSNKFPWRIKLRFFWFVFKGLFGFGKNS